MGELKYFENLRMYYRELGNSRYGFPVQLEADHKTAINWVNNYRSNQEAPYVDIPNKFENIKLLGYETRGNGGLAFKVVLNHDGHDYIVDLRLNTLIDVMSMSKVENDILYGEFVFLNGDGNTKLFLENSESVIEAKKLVSKMSSVVKVPIRELEVGKVYYNSPKLTSQILYLGDYFVDILELDDEDNLKIRTQKYHITVDNYYINLLMEKLNNNEEADFKKELLWAINLKKPSSLYLTEDLPQVYVDLAQSVKTCFEGICTYLKNKSENKFLYQSDWYSDNKTFDYILAQAQGSRDTQLYKKEFLKCMTSYLGYKLLNGSTDKTDSNKISYLVKHLLLGSVEVEDLAIFNAKELNPSNVSYKRIVGNLDFGELTPQNTERISNLHTYIN